MKFSEKFQSGEIAGLDNEGLDIDEPNTDGPIVTKLPRRSCLLCICRRSRLLLLSAAQLRRLIVRPAVRPPSEICKKLHMAVKSSAHIMITC